jgi:uridine phosphorylase
LIHDDNHSDRRPPILAHKAYHASSVFTVENLLREARRQKALADGLVPSVCVLDPDGDIAEYLISTERATRHPHWACYHTRLYTFSQDELALGILPYAVGASFAVLVAEELFASGCQLLISITSAGQIVPAGPTPYFVLIDRALRDEGTSYHYLPPSSYSRIADDLKRKLHEILANPALRILQGGTWTTDGPFRETEEAIAFAQAEGLLGVEMEAAALYAFAQARGKAVVCFAHITNQMATLEGDFEKGENGGSRDALHVIELTARRWLAAASQTRALS